MSDMYLLRNPYRLTGKQIDEFNDLLVDHADILTAFYDETKWIGEYLGKRAVCRSIPWSMLAGSLITLAAVRYATKQKNTSEYYHK